MRFLSWKVTVSLIVLGLASPVACWFRAKGPLRDPRDALNEFYHPVGTVAEDMLMDPLILCGDRVVPLVIDGIRDKDMIHRRYAIAFLGNGEHSVALPTLEAILSNPTEFDCFRGDALVGIYKINREAGLHAARHYASLDDCLGWNAQRILDEKVMRRRSYSEALTGAHDVSLCPTAAEAD